MIGIINNRIEALEFLKIYGSPIHKPQVRSTRRVRACQLITTEVEDGVIYQSPLGGWMKVSSNAVVVCMPYPMSANVMWRSAKGRNGKGYTNILSEQARKFKADVWRMFAPLLKALDWKPIDELCEARIVVQPPVKRNNYTNKTHPRFDIDNYSKPVLDALKGQELLFIDDRIFVSEKVELAAPIGIGRVWLSCVKVDDTNWLKRDVPHKWLQGGQNVT